MLNSGQKFRALRDKKNKYSNSCVVRNNISERNKKPSVKWKVPKSLCGNNFVDSIYRLSVNIKLIYIYIYIYIRLKIKPNSVRIRF